MHSIGIPQGMRDILIEESRKRTALQEKLRHYMQSCGFERIETPLFEYYELFSGDISTVENESIIKTIDGDGRVIVLRPDMTAPTVRVAATKLKDRQKPLKLYYMGNVYRADRKRRGSGREFSQIGAEIFGCSGKWLDIEVLSMARGSLREAGVSDYKIDIGHAGIIKGIFRELPLTEEKKSGIISLISEKNLVELEREVSGLPVDGRYKEVICKLPRFFGRPEDVFGKMDEIIINEGVRESARSLYEIYEKCRDMGLQSNLIIDAGMTGSMKYYTGLVFRVYAQGTSDVVISGGRYDDLLGELGISTTAAGFAVYADSMVEAAAKESLGQEKERKVLALFTGDRFIEALEYSESLRRQGITVNLINCKDVADTEQYCRQYGYGEIADFR